MTIAVTEVKKRLLALLNDANMVNEYIRQYGPSIDIKNIKAIKEQRLRASKLSEEGEGNDPIYEIKVKCPVCNKDNITCYDLRAKSQQILQNKFLVPVYAGAMGYRTVDYTLLAVVVCPRCLFASPDKKDFIKQTPGLNEEVKSQLTSNILMTLQEKIGERKSILKTITDYETYFKRPRLYDAAITSYRIAMARATVEAWYEQPYSLYKSGAYVLRIAKIMKDSEMDNSEVLREALGFYEESFRTSNCPSEEIEMQVLYTIVALYLKLGDPKKAQSYIGVFKHLRAARVLEMKENPKLTPIFIDKWADKASTMWEYRDEKDYFKEE